MTTRFMVRNSGRGDFTQCRWKYERAYVDRIRPNDSGGMNALVFGDICHRGLSGFYVPERSFKKVKRGVHPAVTVERIFEKLEEEHRFNRMRLLDTSDTSFHEHKELGISMMNNYVETYGDDDKYMVVYPEMPFQHDVFDGGKYVFTMVGTTDCLVRERSTGKFGLLEHKTAATISTGHLVLDEQANTYWTVLPMWLRENEILKEDQDLEFMDYNFLLKKVHDIDGPRNDQGQYLKSPTIAKMASELNRLGVEYSKSGMKKEDYQELCTAEGIDWEQLGDPSATQPTELFHRERVLRTPIQREKAFTRLLQQVREMKRLHAGSLPAYKEPAKHCTWCQYKDLCEIDEYGSETEDLVQYGFHHWNPFADHIWALDIT